MGFGPLVPVGKWEATPEHHQTTMFHTNRREADFSMHGWHVFRLLGFLVLLFFLVGGGKRTMLWPSGFSQLSSWTLVTWVWTVLVANQQLIFVFQSTPEMSFRCFGSVHF